MYDEEASWISLSVDTRPVTAGWSSWQLVVAGGQSDQGWNISQRSSQQPPASHPRILGSGPDNLLASPGHRHNVHRAGAGDVPLHDNLCTESPRQYHQSPVPGEVQRWPGRGGGVYKQQHNESVVPVLGPGEMWKLIHHLMRGRWGGATWTINKTRPAACWGGGGPGNCFLCNNFITESTLTATLALATMIFIAVYKV